MADIEDLLDPGDMLSSVRIYDLNRTTGKVFIYVQEILNGDGKGLFVAYPTFIVGGTKKEYIAMGKTHEEALKECLSRLKGVRPLEIRELPSGSIPPTNDKANAHPSKKRPV